MIAENIASQDARIAAACTRSGRSPSDVRLVAVSKAHPVAAIREAYAAGHRVFGESYVQEFRAKRDEIGDTMPGVEWHFIGHLQTNKVREVAGSVACVHAVDRPSLVAELRKRCTALQDVMIEVNVAGEASKFGCVPDEAAGLVAATLETDFVRPVGLMTIAPLVDDPEEVRPVFRGLRELRDRIRETLPADAAARFEHLSMGMSGDVETAVEEGATIVRVGTAIFGARRPR